MSFELSLRIISIYGLPLFDHNVVSQNFLLPAPADISLIIIASYYYTCEKNVAEFTFGTSKLLKSSDRFYSLSSEVDFSKYRIIIRYLSNTMPCCFCHGLRFVEV